MDASGVTHLSAEYHGAPAPWMRADVEHEIGPVYPLQDRRLRHTGKGLFRVSVDLATGNVTDVTVVQSTGFETLDRSTSNALRQWRWKPGTWREIDVPVNFGFGPSRPPAGAHLLPHP